MKAVLTVTSKDAPEIEKIKSGFAKMLGEEIDWEIKADKSIIGGFIAMLGGKIYDNSVKTRLDSVSDSFKEAVRREDYGNV